MGNYAADIRRSALKELDGVPTADLGHVMSRIRALETDPRPPGSEKLTGAEQYRVRQGAYRILHEIDDTRRLVTVVKIADRREVCR